MTELIKVVPGQEANQANALIGFSRGAIDGIFSAVRENQYPSVLNKHADVAFKWAAYLHELFSTSEVTIHNPGYWMVGFENPNVTPIDDINKGTTWAEANEYVSNHGSYFHMDHDDLMQDQAFEVFWSILAQQLLQNIPLDETAFKLHLLNSLLAMFNGSNKYGVTQFRLVYVEQDPLEDEYYSTNDLSSFLQHNPFPWSKPSNLS